MRILACLSVVAALSYVTSLAIADSRPEFAACKQTLCRGVGVVHVTREDGSRFQVEFPAAEPVVQEGVVTLYPGEELFLEAEWKDGGFLLVRPVHTVKAPEKTLVLKMWQENGKAATYLSVTNPFTENVSYKVSMRRPSNRALRKVSACPVSSRATTNEEWAFAIFQLVLSDFRLAKETDAAECKEVQLGSTKEPVAHRD